MKVVGGTKSWKTEERRDFFKNPEKKTGKVFFSNYPTLKHGKTEKKFLYENISN